MQLSHSPGQITEKALLNVCCRLGNVSLCSLNFPVGSAVGISVHLFSAKINRVSEFSIVRVLPSCFFPCGGLIRQGCTLSPLLFVVRVCRVFVKPCWWRDPLSFLFIFILNMTNDTCPIVFDQTILGTEDSKKVQSEVVKSLLFVLYHI